MIKNIHMQAESHIKLKSLVPLPSYQLNRLEILFVCALAIYVGFFGKTRYTYRINVAFQCLCKLVQEFNNDHDVMNLNKIALHRLLQMAEAVPKPDNIDRQEIIPSLVQEGVQTDG